MATGASDYMGYTQETKKKNHVYGQRSQPTSALVSPSPKYRMDWVALVWS